DVGEVRVVTGSGGVTVDVKRHARNDEIMRDFNVTFDQSGDNVTVRAKFDRAASRWFNWGNDLDAEFTVTVPSHFNLQISTSGGPISVADLTGDVHLRTSGGDVTIGRISGPVD